MVECGSWWGAVIGFYGKEVSHPTIAGATGREDSDVVKHVNSRIRLFWFKSWLLLFDSWFIFFLFSTSLRCN